MRKIKNVIFDLGGVLLNIDPIAVAKRLDSMGLNATEIIENEELKRLMLDFEKGLIDVGFFRKRVMHLAKPLAINDAAFDDLWCSILLDFPAQRIKKVENLGRYYDLYLLSNTNQLHYDRFTTDFRRDFGYDFDSLFKMTFYSFRMNMVKPDPIIFETVLRRAGLMPEETLFIDDLPQNTNSAATLGIKAVNVSSGGFDGDIEPFLD